MKDRFIGKLKIQILMVTLACTACASVVLKPTAQPEQRALKFYEFYSSM